MDSDLQHQQLDHHFQGLQRQFQLPKQQMNTGGGGGGLTRFRSAPSSYFSALMDPAAAAGAGAREVLQPRPLSTDTESFLAQFVESVTDAGEGALGTDSPAAAQLDFAVTVKQEIDQQIPDLSSNRSSSVSCNQMSYHGSSKPPLAKRSSNSFMGGSGCGLESNFRVPSMNILPSMKMETGLGNSRNASSLSRFKSSPAGLFDDIIIENGYLVTRAPGSNHKTINNDEMNLSINQGQIATPTGMSSANTDIGGNMGIAAGGGNFISSFPVGSWDASSSMFSDQFSKPEIDVGELNPSENQEKAGEVGNRPWGMLAHHLSLPKASLEKLMQLQDSVPCQMRAKRGCATHPRSIAERVRRTKISERMRKLQDLVPNMDKQTNTSDMLDLAADYIKDLQRQLQTLANGRARCTCST